MTRNEFIKFVEYGSDILIEINGVELYITDLEDGSIMVSETGRNAMEFKNAKEAVDSYKIAGVSIGELSESVKVKDYSQNGSGYMNM